MEFDLFEHLYSKDAAVSLAALKREGKKSGLCRKALPTEKGQVCSRNALAGIGGGRRRWVGPHPLS